MSSRLVGADALFLHIPKTGGTWVEHALPAAGVAVETAPAIDGVTFRHAIPSQLKQQYAFTFTFVRHPLSWYESWWKFQAGHWDQFEPGVWHPQRGLESCRADDFSEFIRLCLEREPGYVTRMYEWYIGPPGHEFVDFVGRYETLADDLIRALTILDRPFDEAALRGHSPENVSVKRKGLPTWNPALRKRVLELEAPTLRRFYPEGDLAERDRPRGRLRGLSRGVARWLKAATASGRS